jgi:glycosyltransferase involved in cell wall biosynthesis
MSAGKCILNEIRTSRTISDAIDIFRMNPFPATSLQEKISVVICAKNEAGGIFNLVAQAKKFAGEVLVIDGHSSDGTADLAQQAGAIVWLDNGKGKGAAYKLGLQKASGEVVVFLDGDGSHEVRDIPLLAQPLLANEADLVVASRHKGGSDEWRGDLNTYIRHVGNGILSISMNYKWHANLTDVLNGYRALRREAALKIPLKPDGFDIEQHMIAQFLKYGYRVTEVSSHEYCRGWGESKLPTYQKAYLFFWRLFLDLMTRK